MRRFVLIFLMLGLIFSPTFVGAAEANTPPPAPKPRGNGPSTDTPSGDVVSTVPGADGGGDEYKPKSSCPDYRVTNMHTTIGAGAGPDIPSYGYYTYICNGIENTVWGCLNNACPGIAPLALPVDPQTIRDHYETFALQPDGIYAPPVHRGSTSYVGLRLYFSTNPDRWKPNLDSAYDIAGHRVVGSVKPVALIFTAQGQTVTCKTAGTNPTTAAGRKDKTCSVIVNDRPPSGKETITLTIKWQCDVVSDVPGITNDTWYVDRTETQTINVHEIQAVIQK
jgi:hypothetical protein